MQSRSCTYKRSCLKPDAGCVKFTKPRIAPNVLHIEYKGVPSLQQRAFVSFGVAIVPPMLQESIEIEFFFSAKVTRADVEAVQRPRIE